MSSAAVKDLVVQKINELRIKERTNFKDPHVLNQLGLFAMTQEFISSFIYRCFAAALVLDPSFLRAKRNFLEFKRRELIRRVPFLGKNFGGSFFGIPADAVDEVATALLSLPHNETTPRVPSNARTYQIVYDMHGKALTFI
eukprot:gene14714-10524_t